MAVPGDGALPTRHEVSTPRVHPRRLPETTGRQVRARARQIVLVAAKHFAPLAYRRARKQPLPDNAFARPLRLTFEELGTTFMKFGQLIGSAPGVFGEEVADEFRSCLDTGPAVPFDLVRHTIEDELGMALEDAYRSFDPNPIGRASIAVVHRATTHDGRDVAVKVLRPGIEQRIAVDLDLLQPLLEVVVRQTGDQAAGSLLQMFEGFRLQLGEELDLRNEARAMEHYRGLLEIVDLPLVTVPEPLMELSSGRVLTMEFLDGVPVDDLAAIAAYGYDPKPVVQQVVQGFLLTAIRWGNFHGDVHAGNLLMLRDGRIGVIDWGIVGRLDPETHYFFRRMIEAALGDHTAWKDIAAHIQKVYGPVIQEGLGLDDDQFVSFVQSMMEPVLTKPFGEVSLADLMNAPQEQVRKVRGLEAHDRSMAAILRRFREQRRLRGMLEAHGGTDTEFDRGTFLLTKQLMYFERYGKMFLSDVSLFHDREFFEKVLAE
jgi:predicted unusual protein kinase regulating ubiquinone biosynthesis (AarF/ABC1/UbiB family)